LRRSLRGWCGRRKRHSRYARSSLFLQKNSQIFRNKTAHKSWANHLFKIVTQRICEKIRKRCPSLKARYIPQILARIIPGLNIALASARTELHYVCSECGAHVEGRSCGFARWLYVFTSSLNITCAQGTEMRRCWTECEIGITESVLCCCSCLLLVV
jgi:hypothetical protein